MADSFPKRTENIVGKGENARYVQFLLFPQCCQKTRKNQGLFGKVLKWPYLVDSQISKRDKEGNL